MSTITVTPSHNVVSPSLPHVDVLVQMGAPALVAPTRPSLNLAVVVDVSSSMRGLPLENAKAAAISLVSALTPSDRLAVVAYADATQVVHESVPMTEANKALVVSKLRDLVAMGNTALHSGWLHGAQSVAPFVSQEETRMVSPPPCGEGCILEHGQVNLCA